VFLRGLEEAAPVHPHGHGERGILGAGWL